MKITLYTDFVDDGENVKRQLTIKRKLPNKDAYHLFEAWMHLSECKNPPSNVVDKIMDAIYEIVADEAKTTLGLTDAGHRNGDWDIIDPMVDNEDEMTAIITVYVK